MTPLDNDPLMDEAPLDLDAIEKRADAATAGPWRYDEKNDQGSALIRGTDGGSILSFDQGIPGWEEGGFNYEVADAEFCAHSRTDVPALVAEVRAARKLHGLISDNLHEIARFVGIPAGAAIRLKGVLDLLEGKR